MEKQIQYKSQNINYKIEGQGLTLVLLHGFMEYIGMWTQHSKELSKENQVILIDLPGHGKTGIWAESHSMDFMAEIVNQVLEAEGVDKCMLIGHSMGGYTSLAFAEHYPEKLIGIGLFHSHSMADSEEAKINRDRTIKIVEQQKSGFITTFIPSLYAESNRIKFEKEIASQIAHANQMNPKGITAALAGMKERSMRLDVIAFSKVPVLFILGKQDNRISLDHAIAQASTANKAQIIILGDSGHMAWIEEEAKTIAAIKGFLLFCQA